MGDSPISFQLVYSMGEDGVCTHGKHHCILTRITLIDTCLRWPDWDLSFTAIHLLYSISLIRKIKICRLEIVNLSNIIMFYLLIFLILTSYSHMFYREDSKVTPSCKEHETRLNGLPVNSTVYFDTAWISFSRLLWSCTQEKATRGEGWMQVDFGVVA